MDTVRDLIEFLKNIPEDYVIKAVHDVEAFPINICDIEIDHERHEIII